MPTSTTRPHKNEGGLGFRRLIYDFRFRRRKHRQAMGAVLIFVLTFLGSPVQPLWTIGAAVVAVGLAIRLWASGIVHKNDILATTGPYGLVRHPLYVGNILIGVGFCFASGAWWSGPALLALLLYFYPQTIAYEDRKLRKLFGEPWDRWAAQTRALLPRMRPYGVGERTPWSLRLSMLRNGEPAHIVVAVLCLAWLYHHLA